VNSNTMSRYAACVATMDVAIVVADVVAVVEPLLVATAAVTDTVLLRST